MRHRKYSFIVAATLAAVTLSPASGLAAPQILGFVATTQPVPLNCVDGTCTAELSTVCLQEHRPAPIPGTAYTPSKQSLFTLTVAGRDGGRITRQLNREVSIEALRNMSSVRIRLPESLIHRNGAGSATISVAAMSSAIPVPVAGDNQPQTSHEIANYTGGLRSVAGHIVDLESPKMATLQLLNQVLNRLPGHISDDQSEFDSVWRNVVSEKAAQQGVTGHRKTVEIGRQCRTEMSHGNLADMKTCVIFHHDSLALEATKKVWKALKPGG